MRVLVTGGAGFIGHHLVRALLDQGHDVRVIDDFSTGDRKRLEPFMDRIICVEGSILDPRALDEAAFGCQVILHEAAIPSVARSLKTPLHSNEVNVSGTIQVMLAAARAGVIRVVLAGSSSVYGVPDKLPVRESMAPNPKSPYGVSKMAAERYLHTLGDHHGIKTVSLRYFNVFGPGQDPDSEYAAVVPRFITAILEGRRPVVNGSGDISRDFTFIDNVVSANLLASSDTVGTGITCNVACGERTTLLQLIDAIGEFTGRHVDPEFGPTRAGDIVHSLADISEAQRELGYQVAVPFNEGIRKTVSWFSEMSAANQGSATTTSGGR